MTREHLYRGLRSDGGGWVEGDLINDYMVYNDEWCPWIMQKGTGYDVCEHGHRVHPSTVGQFVDTDDSIRRPFSGDKIRAFKRSDTLKKHPIELAVTYLNGCFMAGTYTWHELYKHFQTDWEIIGTIHDDIEGAV